MSKLKIGIVRGGPSQEHEVSLKTGAAVLKNLPEKYEGVDVIITKNGDWTIAGVLSSPDRIFGRVDAIFNALHGYFGEDGKIQRIFEQFNMPYTGSGALSSAIGMNKILARNVFADSGLLIPAGEAINREDNPAAAIRKIIEKMGPSWIVKPASSGSSVGVSVARNIEQLAEAMENAFQFDSKILVEKCIEGREATCGVLENFRNEKIYALPPIEIIPPPKFSFFDYGAKYGGETQELCPSNFSSEIKQKIETMARRAHEALGCRHYSRSDFIVSNDGKIYLLETNTLPGLTEQSLVPKALAAVGSSHQELIEHLINLAIRRA